MAHQLFLDYPNKPSATTSKSETGHVINIYNFKRIYDCCVSYGVRYQPTNPNISIVSLHNLWLAADAQNEVVSSVLATSKAHINQREIAFQPLSKLITRVQNSLNASGANEEVIRDGKGLAKRFKPQHRKKKKQTETDETAPADKDWVSNSHRSFVQQVNYFDQYIELLKVVPEYAPNETDLKVASLEALLIQLKGLNDNIGLTVIAPIQNARIRRNHLLYEKDTGMVDISLKVKNYVRSVFGPKTDEARLVTKIRIKRFKRMA